jgi:hypothetical protein
VIADVQIAPINTTNITGLRHCTRGLSFLNDSQMAGRISAGSKIEDVDLVFMFRKSSRLA